MFKMIKVLKFQLFCFQKSFQKPNIVLNKCIYNARIIDNKQDFNNGNGNGEKRER